jgi:hypothetical protein
MIEPATIGDWVLLIGALATVVATAIVGYRFALSAEEIPETALRASDRQRTQVTLRRDPSRQGQFIASEGLVAEERGDAA